MGTADIAASPDGRNLYAVADKDPKRFRSLFTENGYWWDVPAGVKYRGDEVARAADIYSAAFPDMHRELSDLYFDGDVVVVTSKVVSQAGRR